MGVGGRLRVTGDHRAERRRVVGVVLAAGAGTRMGTPKALVRSPGRRAVADARGGRPARGRLRRGGRGSRCRRRPCTAARPDRSRRAGRRRRGLGGRAGASLAAGLRALGDEDTACVTLVDLPTLPAAVVRRVLGPGSDRDALRRAVFGERPGHPVLVGPDTVRALLAAVTADPGDRSAGRLAAAGRRDGRRLRRPVGRRGPDRDRDRTVMVPSVPSHRSCRRKPDRAWSVVSPACNARIRIDARIVLLRAVRQGGWRKRP